MKYILLTLAMALIVAVTSCENGKVELPVGNTGTDTVDTEETVDIDMTAEDNTDIKYTTFGDTTVEVTTVTESTESPDTSETQDTSADYADIQSIIDENLDILSSDPYSSKSEQEIIDTYPDNFSAIVSLGKAALPYIEQCASDTDNAETMSDTLRAIIARNAAYLIDPSLYDLVFESPDEKSRIIASVRAFADDHARNPEITYGKLLLDNAGSIRQIESSEFNFTDVNVAWSDDIRYAVIFGTQKEDCFPVIALFVDIADGSLVSLPSLDIYNYILEKEPDLKSFLSFTARSCKWDSENPTIEFELSVGAAFYPQTIHGQYTFDAKTHEIKDVIYDLPDIRISDVTLTDEEIRKVVDKNLDVLAKDSNAWVTEEEMINAHPEAFENIVSLGKDAIEYLEETGNGYRTVKIGSVKYNRCFIALAAAYVIDPDTADLTLASPDNSYAIKCTVSSFFLISDPFSGILYIFSIIDNSSGSVLIATWDGFSLDGIRSVNGINWSPNNRYVIVEQGYHNYFTELYLFDLEQRTYIRMPDAKEIESHLGGRRLIYAPGTDSELSCDHYTFEDWCDDNTVRVTITLSNTVGSCMDVGSYLYDMSEKKIIEVEYD